MRSGWGSVVMFCGTPSNFSYLNLYTGQLQGYTGDAKWFWAIAALCGLSLFFVASVSGSDFAPGPSEAKPSFQVQCLNPDLTPWPTISRAGGCKGTSSA